MKYPNRKPPTFLHNRISARLCGHLPTKFTIMLCGTFAEFGSNQRCAFLYRALQTSHDTKIAGFQIAS